MSRLPLIDPDRAAPAAAAALDAIAGEGELVPTVYRVLANSPLLLKRVHALASYLWNRWALDPSLAELVILRVAQLTRSDYEWCRHRELAERVGVERAKIEGLSRWRDGAPPFDAGERCALALVDEVVERVGAAEDTVTAVDEAFGARATLELVILIGFYI